MRTRDLEERDIPVLERLHQDSGFDYPFPQFFVNGKLNSDFTHVQVLEDDDGTIINVMPGKKLIEMYFFLNPHWRNPRWRLEALRFAHEEMRKWLVLNGWPEVQCWPPPQVEKSFGKRLSTIFHWTKSRWQSYSRRTEAIGNES